MPRSSEITPELHAAGVTVLHQSPFDDLGVPVPVPLDARLRDRWVKPFYQKLPHDVLAQEAALRLAFHEVTPDLITALLSEFNWRPRIVGAFFIALDRLVDFEELVGNLLLRSDVCYAGYGYSLALARLNTPAASNFLEAYLRYYLTRTDLWFDQAVAFAALRHLDRVNGTIRAREFEQPWREFVRDKPTWDIDRTCAQFDSVMSDISSLRGRL